MKNSFLRKAGEAGTRFRGDGVASPLTKRLGDLNTMLDSSLTGDLNLSSWPPAFRNSGAADMEEVAGFSVSLQLAALRFRGDARVFCSATSCSKWT